MQILIILQIQARNKKNKNKFKIFNKIKLIIYVMIRIMLKNRIQMKIINKIKAQNQILVMISIKIIILDINKNSYKVVSVYIRKSINKNLKLKSNKKWRYKQYQKIWIKIILMIKINNSK